MPKLTKRQKKVIKLFRLELDEINAEMKEVTDTLLGP